MPLKTRKKAIPYIYHVNGDDGSGPLVDEHRSGELISMQEDISYGVSKLGVGYNECKHTKQEVSHVTRFYSQIGETEISHLTFDPITGFILNSRPGSVPFSWDLAALADALVDDQKLNHRACRSMMPKLPKSISVLNFLWEMKEFLKMFEFWALRRSLLENISNGTLNEEFGWRPFLSDVCDLLVGLRDFRKKYKKFLQGMHIPHVRHFRKILTEDNLLPRFINHELAKYSHGQFNAFPLNSDSMAAVGFSYYGTLQSNHKITPEYIATMKFTYFAPDLLKSYGELRAILDAFNIYWDPQVIWNAIPFSFIVDWFFNVGDWLHNQFSAPNAPVYTRIIDFCTSVKVDIVTEGDLWVPSNLLVTGSPDSYLNWRDRYKLYHRKPGVPILEDPLHLLSPLEDLRKIILALALGHNCSRPLKRKPKHRGKPAPRKRRRNNLPR
jgi:hypothetical protein